MQRGRPKLTANEKRLRARLAEELDRLIGTRRGEMSRLAKKAGVTKQSLSLYKSGDATPTPETLRKLCSALPIKLDILGAVISAGDIPTKKREPSKERQMSLSLAEALLSLPDDRLRVEVARRKTNSIELKVWIDFTTPKVPVGVGRSPVVKASKAG